MLDLLKVNNPLAHEYTTGPEIIDAVVSTPSTPSRPSSGQVDVVIAGAGTGGTVTGVSRAMKKHNKDCIIVGIDPASAFSIPVISIFLMFWFKNRKAAFWPTQIT